MRVDLITNRPAAPQATGGILSEWRVGAILEAVAVRDVASGQLWLAIGNQRYNARVASGDLTGPKDGETLKLKVLRTSPVLAVETVDETNAAETDTDVTSSALRVFMPRQTSPALLVANLGFIANESVAETSPELPKPVADAAAKLWDSLPQADDLATPDGLKNAVQQSGAFLESKLASPTTPALPAQLATDLKALMLNLSRMLKDQGARPSAAAPDLRMHNEMPSPRSPLTSLPSAPATLSLIDGSQQQLNELARQADGALARLTSLQIAGTPQDGGPQALMIELPIRHEDRTSIARFRIERERSRRRDAPDETTWTVETALDLGQAGALHARVTLVNQHVSVQLRADSPTIVEQLMAHSNELDETLREAGLAVDRIVCLHGMPAGDTGARPTRLLDLRA